MPSLSFLSARPVRAATRLGGAETDALDVSIRAARAGRDPGSLFAHMTDFVSIRAARAGRDSGRPARWRTRHRFYPRGPCGPRRELFGLAVPGRNVSIRAARAGRDPIVAVQSADARGVSIRAARAGRDRSFITN